MVGARVVDMKDVGRRRRRWRRWRRRRRRRPGQAAVGERTREMTMRLRRDVAGCVHVEVGDVADAAGVMDLIPHVVRALSAGHQASDRLAADGSASPSFKVPLTWPPNPLPGAVSTEQTARMVGARVVDMEQVPRRRWRRGARGGMGRRAGMGCRSGRWHRRSHGRPKGRD